MAKSAPRTMRFEEDVEAIINSVTGDSFTDKFHNLVHDYKKTIPNREKKLKELDKLIADREKRLSELNTKIRVIEELKWKFDSFVQNLDILNKQIDKVVIQDNSSCNQIRKTGT